jgi:hypothetical protein
VYSVPSPRSSANALAARPKARIFAGAPVEPSLPDPGLGIRICIDRAALVNPKHWIAARGKAIEESPETDSACGQMRVERSIKCIVVSGGKPRNPVNS